MKYYYIQSRYEYILKVDITTDDYIVLYYKNLIDRIPHWVRTTDNKKFTESSFKFVVDNTQIRNFTELIKRFTVTKPKQVSLDEVFMMVL